MIDLLVLISLGITFFAGFSRGVVKSVFSVVSFILGILVAMKISPYLIEFIESAFGLKGQTAMIFGFVGTLILVIILISFVSNSIERLLKKAHLNIFNKVIGGLVFSLLFSIIIGMALRYSEELDLISEAHIEQSVSYPFLTALPNRASGILEKFKPAFKEFWDKTKEISENIDTRAEK